MLKRFPANATTKDRIDFVYRSPELNFLDSNIHDDARQGIATLSELEANSTIMQSMLSELRILFGLNVAVSVIVRPPNAVKGDCCSAVTCFTDSVLCHLSSNCRQRCSTGYCPLLQLTFPLILVFESGAYVPHFPVLHSSGSSIEGKAFCSELPFPECAVLQVQYGQLRSLFFPESQEEF